MPKVGLGMNESDQKKYSTLSSSTSPEAIISFIRTIHASVAQEGRASISGCLQHMKEVQQIQNDQNTNKRTEIGLFSKSVEVHWLSKFQVP